jgi:hypothetical protein
MCNSSILTCLQRGVHLGCLVKMGGHSTTYLDSQLSPRAASRIQCIISNMTRTTRYSVSHGAGKGEDEVTVTVR